MIPQAGETLPEGTAGVEWASAAMGQIVMIQTQYCRATLDDNLHHALDERYGSSSRRDDLSIAKTHCSATLVHPIVRRFPAGSPDRMMPIRETSNPTARSKSTCLQFESRLRSTFVAALSASSVMANDESSVAKVLRSRRLPPFHVAPTKTHRCRHHLEIVRTD